MHGLVSGVAAVLLIAAGRLTGPAWGNEATDERLAQATAQELAGLDAEKVEQLDAEAERLFEADKYAEAIAIAEQSLAWKEVKLGPEHPDTASSLNNLAELYRAQGLYAKAEPLYQRALTISEKVLGRSTPLPPPS